MIALRGRAGKHSCPACDGWHGLDSMKCARCGATVEQGGRYCRHCLWQLTYRSEQGRPLATPAKPEFQSLLVWCALALAGLGILILIVLSHRDLRSVAKWLAH